MPSSLKGRIKLGKPCALSVNCSDRFSHCLNKDEIDNMANQVAARLSGDDYQHLYSWQFALELLMPHKKVSRVTVEDALAVSVDDVTVKHEDGTNVPDGFYQVKYHVDQRDVYSTEALIAAKPGHMSLLEKFWRTWKQIRQQNPKRPVELFLVSNWTWDSRDKLRACFNGHDNSFTEEFFTAPPKSDIGKLRACWQKTLAISNGDFSAFMRSLRFKLGFDCGRELEQRVEERMDNLGLKSDIAALKVAAGIIREWIKAGKQEMTPEDLE